MIKFITGNTNKLAEIQRILDVEQLDIDLPEIQSTDAHEIIRVKLESALKHHDGEFIVEDTSLSLDCIGGLPGPLIKWFLKHLGPTGIYGLCEKYGNPKAQARTLIGYAKGDEILFFEGVVEGTIVAPTGETPFGWDAIFLPDGFEKTYAQFSREEKNAISQRGIAASKLKQYLDSL